MYADFAYYRDTFHGTSVSEEKFAGLAVRASSYLDYFTMGRAVDNPQLNALKRACCALVEQYAQIDTMVQKARECVCEVASGAKKSESVGSYSVTYQDAEKMATYAKNCAKELEKELPDIVRMYLRGTNLLYRGGSNGCMHHTR